MQIFQKQAQNPILLFGFVGIFFLFFSYNSHEALATPIEKRLTLHQTLLSPGSNLIKYSKNIPYGPTRDKYILDQLIYIKYFTAAEVQTLAGLAERAGLEIVLRSLPKTSPLVGASLVQIVDSLHVGTDRDKALIAGAKLISKTDAPSIKTALEQAYKEKIQVMNLMAGKLTKFSTIELASLATGFTIGNLRDQILLTGTKFLTIFDISGLAEMVNQADLEKKQVALSVLPKVKQLSARDLALVLNFINDGATRDQLISEALPLLKKVDGIGAGLILERSVEHKVKIALFLFKNIPNVSGTDLNQILEGCTSGSIRDQILAQTISQLTTLTKEEAKALHRRGYINKDKLALLIMSKIDEFDGLTIAELARLSLKGSSRDLIILEGLKRLKKIDAIGLIALIAVADKLAEMLALEVVARIPDFNLEIALQLHEVVPTNSLKDRFLSRAVELIVDLDEPTITALAMAASTQTAKNEIVQKGVQRIGDDQ